MIRNAIYCQEETSNNFVTRLVKSNYNLHSAPQVEMIFDSDIHFRNLFKNYLPNEKLNISIRLLVNELKKVGKEISPLRVHEDLSKNKVVVYRVISYDFRKKKLFDFYFILDSRLQKVCCYKRYTDYSIEQKRLIKAVEYLNNSLFLDYEEIYYVLKNNGFNVNLVEVQHLIDEINLN